MPSTPSPARRRRYRKSTSADSSLNSNACIAPKLAWRLTLFRNLLNHFLHRRSNRVLDRVFNAGFKLSMVKLHIAAVSDSLLHYLFHDQSHGWKVLRNRFGSLSCCLRTDQGGVLPCRLSCRRLNRGPVGFEGPHYSVDHFRVTQNYSK